MDIPASALSHPFELYPVHIPGWVTFLQPPNIAHGGIPKSIYDDRLQGLQCVINPLTDLKSGPWIMAAFDQVDLYVNGIRSTGAGHTVQPGDEAKFIVLYLPHGELRDGVNTLHYRVTRLSGNPDDSISLDVLYHLRAPGEPAPQNMDLVIPPDVISDGVSADRAAQGVKFGFTYGNRRDFDRIEFRIGAVAKPYDVPSAPAPAEYTLLTDTFRDVGDGAFTAVQFKVTDQLGNSNLSSDKYIDVHLDRQLTLAPPSVKEASGASLNPVNAKDTLTIVVPVNAELLPTDKLTVTWTGAPGTPAGGSHTSGESLVSAGLEIPIPNSVVAFNLGRSVTVSYAVIRGSEAPVASPPFALAIQPLAPGDLELGKPRILEAANNGEGSELNLASIIANVTCWFGTWPLIAVDQDVWLRFKGTKADNTTPYNLDIWVPKPPTKGPRVNQGWVNNGFYQPGPLGNSYNYLKDLKDGSTLTVEFKADFSKTIDEANAITFPQRTYTVKSIVVVAPTITSVKGQPSNAEIPDNSNTVESSVILSGAASVGQKIELFDGNTSVGEFMAVAGNWTSTAITVAVGEHNFKATGLYGDRPTSAVRRLRVIEPLVIDNRIANLDGFFLYYNGARNSTPMPAGTTVTRTPSRGNPPYAYSTSNTGVATVNDQGVVVGGGNGEAIITITDAYGQTASYTVSRSNAWTLRSTRSIRGGQAQGWANGQGAQSSFNQNPYPDGGTMQAIRTYYERDLGWNYNNWTGRYDSGNPLWPCFANIYQGTKSTSTIESYLGAYCRVPYNQGTLLLSERTELGEPPEPPEPSGS
ncbi:hypothetical protein M1D68_11560 [Pseudomonas sp. R4-84]